MIGNIVTALFDDMKGKIVASYILKRVLQAIPLLLIISFIKLKVNIKLRGWRIDKDISVCYHTNNWDEYILCD